jgi:hypothetical protein
MRLGTSLRTYVEAAAPNIVAHSYLVDGSYRGA